MEPPDHFLYDPRHPVPTRGGALCCWPGALPQGAYDQTAVESREDVLVYTTPPLTADMEVTGPVLVTLYAASSAVDTDCTAKLVDVHPSGFAQNLTDGIIRARYGNLPPVQSPSSQARSMPTPSTCGPPAMSLRPVIAFVWRSPAAISHALTAILTRVGYWQQRLNCCQRSRRFTTTARTLRT
jgi:hypothetical protein